MFAYFVEEEIAFTNWGTLQNEFEPLADKTCATMCTTDDCDFNWHTSDCTEQLSFICEVQLECPEGWVIFENSCYKLEKQKASDVPGAASYCMGEYNSDLMVPNTNEEALFLTDYLTSLSVSELDTMIIVVIR